MHEKGQFVTWLFGWLCVSRSKRICAMFFVISCGINRRRESLCDKLLFIKNPCLPLMHSDGWSIPLEPSLAFQPLEQLPTATLSFRKHLPDKCLIFFPSSYPGVQRRPYSFAWQGFRGIHITHSWLLWLEVACADKAALLSILHLLLHGWA